MCPSCGYSHGAYASCHETQERNWRADWASEARMYAPEPATVPEPVEPAVEPESP